MYRRTKKYESMRESQAVARLREAAHSDAPIEPVTHLPNLRMRITVTRFDFGEETHIIELHKTRRIDQYKAIIDGKKWRTGVGLSGVLEGIRKGLPRVLSRRSQ